MSRKRGVWTPACRDKEPRPVGNQIAEAGHHWIDAVDFDGRSHGLIVLQWQPHVQRWCHSGDIATGRDFDAKGYLYVAPCVRPD